MGMIDSQLVFAEGQAPTAIGDNGSTNEIAFANSVLGDAGQTQENLWITALCTTLATSGGSATVQAVLQDSSDNATWKDVALGPALAVTGGALPAGTVMLQIQPPPGMLQYWRISWRIAVAVLTAGGFDAFVSNSIPLNTPRPVGFVVA